MVKEETAGGQAKGENKSSLSLPRDLEGSEHSLVLWQCPIEPLPFIFVLQVCEANPVAVSSDHLLFYPLLKNKPTMVRCNLGGTPIWGNSPMAYNIWGKKGHLKEDVC